VSLLYDSLKRLEAGNAGEGKGGVPAHEVVVHTPDPWWRQRMVKYTAVLLPGAMLLVWLIWHWQPGVRDAGVAMASGDPDAAKIAALADSHPAVKSAVMRIAPGKNPAISVVAIEGANGAHHGMTSQQTIHSASHSTSIQENKHSIKAGTPAPVVVAVASMSGKHTAVPPAHVSRPPVPKYGQISSAASNIQVKHKGDRPERLHSTPIASMRAHRPETHALKHGNGHISVHLTHAQPQPDTAVKPARKTKDVSVEPLKNLVGELRVAVAQNHRTQVESLLKRLDQRVGMSSMLSLRMHAYWAMKQGKDTAARKYYNQILAQRPDDLRAGINTGLLQWRMGQGEAAVERLRSLRNIYPDSPLLQHYLATMEAAR